MNTIQSVPSSSHPQPVEALPLQVLAAPDTGISDGDDRSNPLNEASVLAACRNNNLVWLRELLAEDPELAKLTAPSGATNHPVSPLHITAQGGHKEATEYLLNTALQGVPEAEKANTAIMLMTLRNSNGVTPFYLAAQNANEWVLLTFLNYLLTLPEADTARALVTVMNTARKDGQTPLCIAIKRGDDRMVCCFLEVLKYSPEAKRADTMIKVLAPDRQSEGKGERQPLHLAASMGNSGIIKLLLETVSAVPSSERSKVARAVVNATDAHGATPLIIAAQGRFGRIVQYILAVISEVPESERAGVGNALVNTANKDGATPLYAATSVKDRPIVSMLLAHGADPEQVKVRCAPGTYRRLTPPRQMAPVLAACSNNDLVRLRELLTEDPELAKRAAPSDATNHPVSPLHITAGGGLVEATECLLNTALQGVPQAEKANVAIMLMTPRHSNGETPLHLAAQNANESVVLTFLNYLLALPEADIARALVAVMNAASKDGQTPLCKAIKRGDDRVVCCFMEALKNSPEAKRADTMIKVLAPDKHNGRRGERQPLHLAASMGNSRIIKSLLESVSAVPQPQRSKVARQVVNATDAHGATPLFIAARGGFARIVQYILGVISEVPESERAGFGNALLNTANKDGATPLYAATSANDRTAVSMLLEHGADLEQAKVRWALGKYKRSPPRQAAVQRGNRSIVALIDKAIQSRKATGLQSGKEPAETV
ncbi:ankyrin repeat domain-containing protein [Endozoicomonas sp. ALB091]|uniref:ankyrin repeat domain-containing protein n=1 Tax=Endozoicomonas sp. ALB091 TaxID=3403073 RepID=UPI003BB4D943